MPFFKSNRSVDIVKPDNNGHLTKITRRSYTPVWDHVFSAYAKHFKKLTFFTIWYAHSRKGAYQG